VNRPIVIGLLIAAAIVAITALSSMFVVNQREQALVVQFGEPKRVIEEPGLNFKIPFIQKVFYFDKRVLNFDAAAQEAPTLDQKQVVVESYAKYRIVDALIFFQRVRDETGAAQRLGPIINSTLREQLGEIPMSLILTAQRADFMRDITAQVNLAGKEFGIEVLDVRMKRVDLPPENSEAIFKRMQTQRQQEAARFRAEGQRDAQAMRAEADKQQVVIISDARRQSEILRGEGDAEATRIYNDAYGQDAAFFDFYRSMQALTEGLTGDTTTYVGPPTGDFFRYFGDVEGRSGEAGGATGAPAQ
jgi:membrane protease subunit HflC